MYFIINTQVCDIYEKVTGSNSLPGYIRDHPTGMLMILILILIFVVMLVLI